MDISSESLIQIAAVILVIADAYSAKFGGHQARWSQIVIDTFAIPSRYRPGANALVSIVIATLLTTIAAIVTGDWRIAPVGLVIGLFVTSSAAEAHDTANVIAAATSSPTPDSSASHFSTSSEVEKREVSDPATSLTTTL